MKSRCSSLFASYDISNKLMPVFGKWTVKDYDDVIRDFNNFRWHGKSKHIAYQNLIYWRGGQVIGNRQYSNKEFFSWLNSFEAFAPKP